MEPSEPLLGQARVPARTPRRPAGTWGPQSPSLPCRSPLHPWPREASTCHPLLIPSMPVCVWHGHNG